MRLPSLNSMRALFKLVAASSIVIAIPNGTQAQAVETSVLVGAGDTLWTFVMNK